MPPVGKTSRSGGLNVSNSPRVPTGWVSGEAAPVEPDTYAAGAWTASSAVRRGRLLRCRQQGRDLGHDPFGARSQRLAIQAPGRLVDQPDVLTDAKGDPGPMRNPARTGEEPMCPGNPDGKDRHAG